MKIALIADELTTSALKYEDVEVKNITPLNYRFVLKFFKPDLLFVESVWHGYKKCWKYKVASYPDYPRRNNKKLQKVIRYAKNLGIPTLFWNKEDGVHFDRFIESAKHFDHIVTVDENCIPKYRAVVTKETTVGTLLFAVQSKFHYFDGFHFQHNRANFVGSYSHHIHNKRKEWQDMMFETASKSELGVVIYDRNSDRKSVNYRFPNFQHIETRGAVIYAKTAEIYKEYLVSLNVNTIEDSKTMFSRRLVEILACGGIAVTNPTPAVENYFSEYCHIVNSKEEMLELFNRFKNGPSQEDLEKAKAGAEYVAKHHTWTDRLAEIKQIIGMH